MPQQALQSVHPLSLDSWYCPHMLVWLTDFAVLEACLEQDGHIMNTQVVWLSHKYMQPISSIENVWNTHISASVFSQLKGNTSYIVYTWDIKRDET